MYNNRIEYLRQIEAVRNSRVVLYVTGDRLGLETQVHPEVLDLLTNHLSVIGRVPKISLILYTRGGHTLAAWSIANLVSQFCDQYEVLVPSKCHSAGTLICLGAERIIMTEQANLGPIDPSVNTPLNPGIPGTPPSANKLPVSVEDVNGYIELAKELGVKDKDLIQVLSILSQHVHPLVLGNVYRSRSQIRMLGRRLLARNLKDTKKIEAILSFLSSETGSHDYTIDRTEAANLGLTVEVPSADLYQPLNLLYSDFSAELELTSPYNPVTTLAGQPKVDYGFIRALVESAEGGSHRFLSRGHLIRQDLADPSGIARINIHDNRISEGWELANV